jgi:hypothetical protein
MMKAPQVEWLIAGEPREVQLEALRRSFYGYKLRQDKDDEGELLVLRDGYTPARGWGHLMEMRLGKTPTMLNEFELFRLYHDFRNMVVFSPNQYKVDWELESERYKSSVPMIAYEQSRLPHMIAAYNKAKGRLSFSVNYEALKYDETLEFLGKVIGPDTYLASDEAIKIKNPQSLFFKGAMLLKKQAGVTRIATGLPMTQGPTDFYSQGRFINMYDGLDFYAFRGRHCKMGGFKNKQIKGIKDPERLESEIKSSSFVAKRKDWGKQSEAEFYEMRLDIAPEQLKHYTEMEQEFVTLIEGKNGDVETISADQVVGKLMKMQQISSGFVYTETGNAVEIMDPTKTPKMKALLELIENELVGKIVIPFHYQKSGDMLLKVLEKYNPAAIFNEGWMRKAGRDVVAEKARFNHDNSCRVMVGNLVTMKYGHDLTGNPEDRSATMFFFENNFSLDDRTQVEARITTAFQDWANVYLDPYCSPAEHRAIKALARKESMVEAVLGPYRDSKTRLQM